MQMTSKLLLCLAHEVGFPWFGSEVMKDSGDQLAPDLSHRCRFLHIWLKTNLDTYYMFQKLNTNLLWVEGICINVFGLIAVIWGDGQPVFKRKIRNLQQQDLVFSDTIENNIIIETCAWTRQYEVNY